MKKYYEVRVATKSSYHEYIFEKYIDAVRMSEKLGNRNIDNEIWEVSRYRKRIGTRGSNKHNKNQMNVGQ